MFNKKYNKNSITAYLMGNS